ncbi:MAG: hypothetical protein RSO15_15350 [Bacteroides sp.]
MIITSASMIIITISDCAATADISSCTGCGFTVGGALTLSDTKDNVAIAIERKTFS